MTVERANSGSPTNSASVTGSIARSVHPLAAGQKNPVTLREKKLDVLKSIFV
jgi:hypothetical protein